MMPLTNIDLIICDYDNTLYTGHKTYMDAVSACYGEYLVEQGVFDTLEEASNRAVHAFHSYGHTVLGFKEQGICPETFFAAVHQKVIDKKLKEKYLLSQAFPAALFERISCQTAIFTQASKDYALEGLRVFGYTHYFKSEHIFGFESLGISKENMKHNPESWARIADRLGVPYHQIAVLEDSAKYLSAPKKLGMTTIYVENDQYLNGYPEVKNGEDIDYHFKTTVDFLNQL